jgi:hypothetical protein
MGNMIGRIYKPCIHTHRPLHKYDVIKRDNKRINTMAENYPCIIDDIETSYCSTKNYSIR